MNNINNFVTLFDSNYLLRGLVLYESLKDNICNFTLHIIAFDDKCYNKLKKLKLDKVNLISLEEFEDDELLNVKKDRNKGEYCWTSTAKAIQYVINMYKVDKCTYVDSDLCFYSNPECLIDEMSINESVLITEHRYSQYCDQTEYSGKYCVQFMTFKNNINGKEVLNWWKNRCIEWCYGRLEDGKMGDQKYLDDWCSRFKGIHELKNLGGGVAPWNVNQYTFYKNNNKIYLNKIGDIKKTLLVFYHFHALELFDKDVIHLAPNIYKIPDTAITYIYKRYVQYMEYIINKYNLYEDINIWRNTKRFRDNNLDNLKHTKNFYHYSLFI